MDLHNIVLHQIIKEQLDEPELNLSENLLPVNELSIEFVEKLIKSYSSKNPTYGVFEDNDDLFPFQKYILRYFEDNDFLSFTSDAMDVLNNKINTPFATGGYVVFVHYTQNNVEFIITVMLDKSVQFSVDDDNLTLRKLKSLDLERMARANRVNFTKWTGGEHQYLSFIKGTRSVSVYFQEFIGSTDMTSSKQNTDNLRVALQTYMRDNNYDEDRKRDVLHRVKGYSLRKYEAEEDLELRAISVLVDDQLPDNFVDFITDNEDVEVSGYFRVTQKAHLKFFDKVIIKERGYSLEFDRNLKGTKIFREGNSIVITEVPANILENF